MLSELKTGSTIHLMGICGTAMASLAGLLQDMGFKITGSDQNVYPPMSTMLASLGIDVMEGYSGDNLKHNPDFVIVGNVISKSNDEAQYLLKSSIPYTSLPKAMGELVIGERNSIVISGTHGKTTTTSMLTVMADEHKLNPGFFVGGIPLNYGKSFKKAEGNYFVIEGDEYDTAFFDKVPKFIYYKPKYVILTGIEFDHADIYSSLEQILSEFTKLLKLIPNDGVLIYNGDCPNIKKILSHANCKMASFGSGESCDYRFTDRSLFAGRNQVSVTKNNIKEADLALKLFGHHNSLNALSCYALASELGWDKAVTLQGLANFKGVKRRQEVIGEIKGITVVEDFAHHPTAVDLTIKSMNEQYPGRRLISIFEPRSATSRRNIFQQEYAKAFLATDIAVVAKPYNQSNIEESERFSTDKLIEDLKNKNIDAHQFESSDSIIQFLDKKVLKGDVILIMSNGGFDGLYKKLLTTLDNKKIGSAEASANL